MVVDTTLKMVNPGNALQASIVGVIDGPCTPKTMGMSGMHIVETFIVDRDGTGIELRYVYKNPRMDVMGKLKDGASVKICRPTVKTQSFRWSATQLPKLLDVSMKTTFEAPPMDVMKDIKPRRAGIPLFSGIKQRVNVTGGNQAIVDVTGVVIAVGQPRPYDEVTWIDVDMVDRSGKIRIGIQCNKGNEEMMRTLRGAEGEVLTVHGVRAVLDQGGLKLSTMKQKMPQIYVNALTTKTEVLQASKDELRAKTDHEVLTTVFIGTNRALGDADVWCLRAVRALLDSVPIEADESFLTEVYGVVVTAVQGETNIVAEYCTKEGCRKRRDTCACGGNTWERRVYAPKISIADYSGAVECSVDGEHAMEMLGGFSAMEDLDAALVADPMSPVLKNTFTVRIRMNNKDQKKDGRRMWAPHIVACAREEYENEAVHANMGGQSVTNCEKEGAVMPVTMSMVEVTEEGIILANGELCSYVVIYAIAETDMKIATANDVCELTAKAKVMRTWDAYDTYTLKVTCAVQRALGMNMKKGQHAILFVNDIDTKEASVTVAAVTVLAAQTAEDLEKQRHGFYIRAQTCMKLVNDGRNNALEIVMNDDNKAEREVLQKIRSSPNTHYTEAFCTPAKKRSAETPSTAATSERKRLRKAAGSAISSD